MLMDIMFQLALPVYQAQALLVSMIIIVSLITLLFSKVPAVFVLIWSTGFIVARYGMPHASPFLFLCLRFLLSGLILAAWATWARRSWPATAREWRVLLVVGVLLVLFVVLAPEGVLGLVKKWKQSSK